MTTTSYSPKGRPQDQTNIASEALPASLPENRFVVDKGRVRLVQESGVVEDALFASLNVTAQNVDIERSKFAKLGGAIGMDQRFWSDIGRALPGGSNRAVTIVNEEVQTKARSKLSQGGAKVELTVDGGKPGENLIFLTANAKIITLLEAVNKQGSGFDIRYSRKEKGLVFYNGNQKLNILIPISENTLTNHDDLLIPQNNGKFKKSDPDNDVKQSQERELREAFTALINAEDKLNAARKTAPSSVPVPDNSAKASNEPTVIANVTPFTNAPVTRKEENFYFLAPNGEKILRIDHNFPKANPRTEQEILVRLLNGDLDETLKSALGVKRQLHEALGSSKSPGDLAKVYQFSWKDDAKTAFILTFNPTPTENDQGVTIKRKPVSIEVPFADGLVSTDKEKRLAAVAKLKDFLVKQINEDFISKEPSPAVSQPTPTAKKSAGGRK